MELRPILSALMRSKVALVLIGLQIALTLAIVCNALFIVQQRFDKMGRPSGMNEVDTFSVTSLGFGTNFDAKIVLDEDLALIRGLPGVAEASPINSLPLSQGGWSTGISLKPGQKTSTAPTAIYMVDEHGIDSLGAKLIAGRNFRPDEIAYREFRSREWEPGAIITKALAEKLWPGDGAVGKQLYLDEEAAPQTVIGVIDVLQAPWTNSDFLESSTLVPQKRPYGNMTRYAVRAEPGRRDEVMKLVEAKMQASNTSRIVRNLRSTEEVRRTSYQEDRAMTIILAGVIFSLLTITALGIVGMASFWVTQRIKQIGTRRALGATRGDILRYFLTENFLITSLGLGLGVALTYVLNYWLIAQSQAQRLPPIYVAIGIGVLWLLGQLAVLGPATRASRVPPAVATRSV